MRHKSHMTNFGRLRNPPQKEEEYSAEEKKNKIKTSPKLHFLAGGFLLGSGKSSQGKSVRTVRYLGEKRPFLGLPKAQLFPGKQDSSQWQTEQADRIV